MLLFFDAIFLQGKCSADRIVSKKLDFKVEFNQRINIMFLFNKQQ